MQQHISQKCMLNQFVDFRDLYIFIWLEANIYNIAFTSQHVLAVFMRSAITLPKVN